jgi:hypothetical protein
VWKRESDDSHTSRLLMYMTPDRSLDAQNWPDVLQQNVTEFLAKAKESGLFLEHRPSLIIGRPSFRILFSRRYS